LNEKHIGCKDTIHTLPRENGQKLKCGLILTLFERDVEVEGGLLCLLDLPFWHEGSVHLYQVVDAGDGE
jgi:hypothetical protein